MAREKERRERLVVEWGLEGDLDRLKISLEVLGFGFVR